MNMIKVMVRDSRNRFIVSGENTPQVNLVRHLTEDYLLYDKSEKSIVVSIFNRIVGSNGTKYVFKHRFFGNPKYVLKSENKILTFYKLKSKNLFSSNQSYNVLLNGKHIGIFESLGHFLKGEELRIQYEESEHFEILLISIYCIYKRLLSIAMSSNDPS